MSNSGWNDPEPMPEKKGWPTWAKVLAGCGCGCVGLVVLMGVTCAGFAHWVRKDPKAFEQKMKGYVQGWAKEDWARLRATVEALRTEEGTKALYAANPGLAEHHGSEAEFLAQAAKWRKMLPVVPEAIPDLDMKGFDYQKNPGHSRIGFRTPEGVRISVENERQGIVRIRVVKENPEPEQAPTES